MNKQRCLVIDVGSSHIKVFAAQIDESDIYIDNHGWIESKGIHKGVIHDVNALANAIQLAVECTKLSEHDVPDRVIVGIGGLDLRSQFALGSIALKGGLADWKELEHVRQAAIFNAPEDRKVLHTVEKRYRLDGCVYDGVPLDKSGSSLELECLLVTVDRTQFDLLEQALKIASVHTDEVIANLHGVSEIIRSYLQPESYLLVDIGAETTDIALYENSHMIRLLSLPVGSLYLTHDLMQGIELDFAHAEKLKCYFGKLSPELKGSALVLDLSDEFYQDKNVQYDFLYDIIDSRVEEIVDMLYNTMSIDLIDREIREMYFTGGSSRLYNFTRHLEQAFSMNVQAIEIGELPKECLQPENISGYGLLYYVMQKRALTQDGKNNGEEEFGRNSSLFDRIKKMLHL